MISFNGQCERCRHLRNTATFTCDAFPGGIPSVMLVFEPGVNPGLFDHRQPYPGDNGIHWEPIQRGTKHPLEEKP